MNQISHRAEGVYSVGWSYIKRVTFATLAAGLLASPLLAADLEWHGSYRVEGTWIKNYTLDKSAGIEDSFLLQHLILEPKMIAADGLFVKSRLDFFNNGLLGNDAGQFFGSYGATNNQNVPAAVTSTAQNGETVQVTQLYMNWVNEFGSLIVGRVPFQFGLGMIYNAGDGDFDHYYGTKDIVAYKLALGNISVMPAYGKVRESSLVQEDDINDYLIDAEYSNPETDLKMGVLFDQREAPTGTASYPTNTPGGTGNDFPIYYLPLAPGYSNPQSYDGYSAYNLNVFVQRNTEPFRYGVELGFLNGYSGVQAQSASGPVRVNLSGFGLAAEAGYHTGNLDFALHAGVASGDNPDTSDYEGYAFSPNYDVAMLMFNYALGQYDVLHSALNGGRLGAVNPNVGYTVPAANQPATQPGLDTETITNAIYVSPSVKWSLGESYDLTGTVCYAQTEEPSVSTTQGSVGSSLGFEVDVGFVYHPVKRFTWATGIGFLIPGSAWAGVSGYANDLAYGATTKAAINF